MDGKASANGERIPLWHDTLLLHNLYIGVLRILICEHPKNKIYYPDVALFITYTHA